MLESLRAAVDKVIAKFKDAVADRKMTFPEIFGLLHTAVAELVALAQSLPATGAEKKAEVLAALGKFIDEVVSPIDIPVIPNWFEPLADRGVKELLLMLADGLIDSTVAIFHKTQWPTVSAEVVATATAAAEPALEVATESAADSAASPAAEPAAEPAVETVVEPTAEPPVTDTPPAE